MIQGTLYPSLNRYFENSTELAHAGCMSQRRLYDCIHGFKDFTRAEKKAISANIIAKILDKPSFDYDELIQAHEAWKGKFDEIYKAKAS